MLDQMDVEVRDEPAEVNRERRNPIKRPKVPEYDRFRMQANFNLYGATEPRTPRRAG
jgi:hypothetical protein